MPAATALLLALARPALLCAQESICEEKSAVLLSDTSSWRQHITAGITILERCANIAPATIVSALRRAKPNTMSDTVAMVLAMGIFDRRMADSIRAMALDSSQSIARRNSYLELLVNYALPHAIIRDGMVTRSSPLIVDTFQPPRRLLDEPLRPPFGTRLIRVEDRTRIVETIAEMARRDPDNDLRQLAAKVAIELPRAIQQADDNDLFKRTWP